MKHRIGWCAPGLIPSVSVIALVGTRNSASAIMSTTTTTKNMVILYVVVVVVVVVGGGSSRTRLGVVL